MRTAPALIFRTVCGTAPTTPSRAASRPAVTAASSMPAYRCDVILSQLLRPFISNTQYRCSMLISNSQLQPIYMSSTDMTAGCLAAPLSVAGATHTVSMCCVLQAGSQCWCGESFWRLYNTTDTCDMPCTGSPGTMCGGAAANSIYKVTRGLKTLTKLICITHVCTHVLPTGRLSLMVVWQNVGRWM